MTTSALKTTIASLLVLGHSGDVARAGRGGFGGAPMGGRAPMGSMGMGGMPAGNRGGFNSGMNGMPPGMSSRGGMGGMGMSGMNGMPPGMSSRGGMGGMGMSGMNGMPPGMSSRPGGMSGAAPPGMNRPPQGATERPGYGTGAGTGYANRPVNVQNNTVNANRYGAPYGAGGAWGSPYGAYHSGWYNGAWNGHYGGYGGYGWGGYGAGAYGWGNPAAMSGMGSWAYGPMLYNMGYSSYSNPYSGAAAAGQVAQGGAPGQVAQGPADNYAQPIDTSAPPPQPPVADEAVSVFDQGREAFKAGDYARALSLTEQALKTMPGDATLHEFRALCLFALKRYDEAAATLYAVLSAGPGWDWTTMISLYPSADVYTGQLRSLEAFSQKNPSSASAHFVLAYHYLSQGNNDDAVGQFQRVVQLQPSDTLSAKLAQMFSKGTDATPSPPPSDAAPARSFNLVGTWSASPAKDTAITLTVRQDGPFAWKVTDHGKTRELGGKSTYGNGLLTLAGDQGPPLVGKVTWADENHFTFQVGGGGALDPGLSFAR
jgi:hypothetical protein